ncbi:hypothetical protein AVEN_262443-1 [Araneus ventricosus]|uniref:Uncharacterized protein n=1 Tax=Araneus ventricosus TaxID=182803 RepID=A0A4Y2W3R0_ARAVE|nr:hypothetical protein AVEN_262443-1 [Araneus ventricosus]
MQLQMRGISRKAQTLFRQDGYIICCTTTEAHTSLRWVGLCCLNSRSRSDGNGKGTPIYTWTNSARAELHLFNILHRRIKFYLPPHGKVRDENEKGSRGRHKLKNLRGRRLKCLRHCVR